MATFRLGDDVRLIGADGTSEISGADFAVAVADEIEKPVHRRARFTLGYQSATSRCGFEIIGAPVPALTHA